MSKINNPPQYSIQNFIQHIYTPSNRDIIFWDTCSLLEILRFPYREGNLNTYRSLNRLNNLIQNDTVYSIASSLTIVEWNDNEDTVKDSMNDSLVKTGNYHKTCLQIINDIYTTAHYSEPLHDKRLLDNFESLVDNIIAKTIFIETGEIANSALERVRDKRPPGSKKQQFKDCAVWETILKLSRDIDTINPVHQQVFFTVNTDDFIDKSRVPKAFHGISLTEASFSNLICCSSVAEVDTRFV